jgi:phospholipid/cholesterol/gamma-HCH transport system substrate-binding protein
MISRKYRSETIVGFFVLVSLTALFITVLIIARQEGLFQSYVRYRATFKNVGGLKPGSEVRLAGVTVGSVKAIAIDPSGLSDVNFTVMKKYSDKIREDSLASIGFVGMLGDKSLDLSVGSPASLAVLPNGQVASVEPLDLTQLLAKMGPSLEDLQTLLKNLAKVSNAIVGQQVGGMTNIIDQLKEITSKVNQGRGSLGLVVNDPKLYQETTATMSSARKMFADVGQGKGALGALIHDPKFKAEMEQSMGSIKEGLARLPDISKKLDEFLAELHRAGKGLPGLVTSGDTMANDVDRTAKAAQKSWLLRSHVPQPQEHTIRLDAQAGKD